MTLTTSIEDELVEMIREYLSESSYYFDLILAYASASDVHDARRNLGWSGTLPNGVRFSFHGIGCRFDDEGRVLEVDFTPDDKVGGFDLFRLAIFAEQSSTKWAQFLQLGTLRRAYENLKSSGRIVSLLHSNLDTLVPGM